ncbi:uncharacterized protein EV420DRAFT_1649830 [Desarmillaria tabescens]|uniref:DUF6535 domain-containing protein n=1 Tax=Armillaria tabescens TaxID=1929756 RepID=A0AA39JFX0_ARMTA|nr:uncharacterized protein EV420DRAFT_1649830 [Desarmillaria tabescens]KAK0442027.1 hypothetical protein EV420DRAFT_1649830 [Desarmillaria tabescens]
MTNDPLSNILPALAINSAFVNSTETRNESSPPWRADASCPVENITRDVNVLPYPCCGSHGHNTPNGIPRSDTAAYECARIAQKYDEGACKDWKEEIDTLLVFAGLFSAVATAFLIDSYKWLLNNTASTNSDTTSLPTQVEKRINVYWFLSLVLALSSASTGMLCKQWLREYIRDAGRSSKDALCVRQMRLEGLSAWKVDGIISTIPLLLQVALVLFFIGMLELLWPLEKTVAIPFTVITAVMIAFILFTTLAPSTQYCSVVLRRSLAPLPPQCPYKSPQAWFLVSIFNRIFCWLTSVRRKIFHRHSTFSRVDLLGPKLAKHCSSWSKYDLYWVKDNADTDASVIAGPTVEHYLGRSISWLMRHFDSPNLQTSLYHLFWNSIQNYDQRTHVFLALAKNHIPELFRGRNIRTKSSNLELIASLAEEKSDEVLFEAMEELEDRFRVSTLADQVLLRAYREWSACSWDTHYKSRCNADFSAVALLYLSGQVGLSGLQHCLRLIKSHLTHPDVNNYNFVIPPGVHAPFNAHIIAVTSDVECLHAPETGLEGDLCDCAKLLLNKDYLPVTPEAFAIKGKLRELQRNRTDGTSSEAPDNQRNPIKPLLVEALWMAKWATTHIPGLSPDTLPYLPQILHFLLKRASTLQTRSQYVCTLMTDMDRYLKELHSSKMPVMVRRDHIRAFINLAIQEFHEHLITESANAHHLDLHSYPEILAFIQHLRNLAALLNVPEERAQWRNILKQCGLEDSPSDSVLLEEVASIPLPPEDLETNVDPSALAAQLCIHGVNIPHLLGEFQLNTAVENMASEDSQPGSRRGLNRSFRHVLRRRNRENDVENGTGVDSIGLEAIPNATVAPVDQSG